MPRPGTSLGYGRRELPLCFVTLAFDARSCARGEQNDAPSARMEEQQQSGERHSASEEQQRDG